MSSQTILKAESKDINFAESCREKCVDLRQRTMFTDAILSTRNHQRFHVHRIILASASTHFENIFRSKPENDVIYMKDGLNENILKILIDYMYTSNITITFENAIDLNYYSYEFNLYDLKEKTGYILQENINSVTCLNYWRYADKMLNTELRKKCLKFIFQYPEQFFDSSLKDLTSKEFEEICKGLRCAHDIILKNIMIWSKIDFDSRKWHLRELLDNIDLDELSQNIIQELENDSQLKYNSTIQKLLTDFYRIKAQH